MAITINEKRGKNVEIMKCTSNQIIRLQEKRRMLHGLKLYLHKLEVNLCNLPDDSDQQAEYFKREAAETHLQIIELERNLKPNVFAR